MKTVKMIFPKDTYSSGKLIAKANEIVDIPVLNAGSIGRWENRGGSLVQEESKKKNFKEDQKVIQDSKESKSINETQVDKKEE